MTAPRKTPVQVMIYNPFDTPLFIKKMKATNYWQGKYFGDLDEEVNLTVPPKSTVRSPTVTMVSPAGFGFMGTLLPFMLKYPQLLVGIAADVPFDIQSTIVTYVGGQSGYFGNVGYNQTETIIKVQVGGKAPAGALPASLADLLPKDGSNNSTSTVLPTVTATSTTIGEATATAPTASASDSTTPAPTTTSAATETIAKRQVQSLEAGPGSEDPAVVEAWIKAMVNKLAVDEGLPAYY
jgi:hypothetical protein